MKLPVSHIVRKLADELKASFRIEREDEDDPSPSDPSPLGEVIYTPGASQDPGDEEYSTNKPSRMVEDSESLKEKTFVSSPKVKPRRRSLFNESDTRGYRRDYQEEYRKQNGNGYIKKLKSPEERSDG